MDCNAPGQVSLSSQVTPWDLSVLQCPGGTFTPGMASTRDYPEDLVQFARTHPLMYNAVYPIRKRPLLVRSHASYEFTAIAVDQVDAVDGRYHVLFLGT
ncbi:hypothetical protein chiPu_0029352, partial [Chiloscyllium punctatum]|nr:hypothetical protein [Chiloscyllium punctatum]